MLASGVTSMGATILCLSPNCLLAVAVFSRQLRSVLLVISIASVGAVALQEPHARVTADANKSEWIAATITVRQA
jgi:hypothetical protein